MPEQKSFALAASHADCTPEEADSSRSAASDEAHAQFIKHLFERYRHPLMSYLSGLLAQRSDAEDVLQEAYTRLLKTDGLDRTDTRARAYLFKTATHLAYDRFRRRRECSLEDGTGRKDPADDGGSPEAIVDFAQGLEVIRRALLELKPRCRNVFLLRASEGLSYEAIADRLGISKRTVEREMKHALDVCQRRLKR